MLCSSSSTGAAAAGTLVFCNFLNAASPASVMVRVNFVRPMFHVLTCSVMSCSTVPTGSMIATRCAQQDHQDFSPDEAVQGSKILTCNRLVAVAGAEVHMGLETFKLRETWPSFPFLLQRLPRKTMETTASCTSAPRCSKMAKTCNWVLRGV